MNTYIKYAIALVLLGIMLVFGLPLALQSSFIHVSKGIESPLSFDVGDVNATYHISVTLDMTIECAGRGSRYYLLTSSDGVLMAGVMRIRWTVEIYSSTLPSGTDVKPALHLYFIAYNTSYCWTLQGNLSAENIHEVDLETAWNALPGFSMINVTLTLLITLPDYSVPSLTPYEHGVTLIYAWRWLW